MVTLEQLKQITNQKESILVPFIQPLNELYAQNVLNTKQRFCFYLANILHETGSLKWLRELSSGKQYEGRKDLNNIFPNDGPKFLGRGVLMTTGRGNYQKVSDYLKVDFVSKPELLETPKYAVLSSEFFWKSNNLNKWADQGNFLQVCYRINGGQTHLQDRLKYLKKAFKVLEVPDYQKLLTDTLLQIKSNISATKNSHFKKMLAKEIPDLAAYNKLLDFLSKI